MPVFAVVWPRHPNGGMYHLTWILRGITTLLFEVDRLSTIFRMILDFQLYQLGHLWSGYEGTIAVYTTLPQLINTRKGNWAPRRHPTIQVRVRRTAHGYGDDHVHTIGRAV